MTGGHHRPLSHLRKLEMGYLCSGDATLATDCAGLECLSLPTPPRLNRLNNALPNSTPPTHRLGGTELTLQTACRSTSPPRCGSSVSGPPPVTSARPPAPPPPPSPTSSGSPRSAWTSLGFKYRRRSETEHCSGLLPDDALSDRETLPWWGSHCS